MEQGTANPRTVYSWLDTARASSGTDLDALFGITSQPTVRVWGDAVIRLVAERRGITCSPPVSIRSNALFGWLRFPPVPARAASGPKVPVRLNVDPGQCALARIDLIHPVFDTVKWRQLGEWLREQGHDPEFIYEAIMPISEPRGTMPLTAGPEAVELAGPRMLDELLGYFEADVMGYLDSWHPLGADSPAQDHWEVVIPRAGLLELVSGGPHARGAG